MATETHMKNVVSKSSFLFAMACGCVLFVSAVAADQTERVAASKVPYPDGFRTWTHVKTALVSARHPEFERSGGFRHIYANPQAVEGYRGGTFAEGAVIVVEWLEAKDNNGAFTEGGRRRLDVMMKDRTQFSATGGWGFEQFFGTGKNDRGVTDATNCLSCHAGSKAKDMVFSKMRD